MDVRATAARLISLGARFVAITSTERPDHEIRLDYQWDLNGQLLSFITATAEKRIASITDLCPAADWVERETHEYFAIDYTGRETTRSLMTRDGDRIGINLHKEAVK
jgi:NADH:ubiquinone oxidoreductase subunit C